MSLIVKCPFCEIVNLGKHTRRLINQNTMFSCILDAYPTTYLHMLVITNQHYEDIREFSRLDLFLEYAFYVSDQLKKKLPDSPTIDLSISGGSIKHPHIHLLPFISGLWVEHKNIRRIHQKQLRNQNFDVVASLESVIELLRF